MKILVTGSNGFVGKNLIETLKTIRDGKCNIYDISNNIDIYEYDTDNSLSELKNYTKDCDIVFHLAGINRPQNTDEFYSGNYGFTEILCNYLKENQNKCPIIVSSSIQADKDNDYGKSKKMSEDFLLNFGKENGNKIYIYRFANLFGKWCRPNYNSVVATWCYNIAHDLDIQINNPDAIIPLCYIDDVVNELIHALMGHPSMKVGKYYVVEPIHEISLKKLSELLYMFHDQTKTLIMPEIPNHSLEKKLYSTYLSYLPKEKISFPLKMNIDERGSFIELLKTEKCGQFSVNISKPGITKGQHWHHSKWEFFIVVSGHGLIQERKIGTDEIIEFEVSGDKIEAVHMLPGYTHNIINLSETDDLVTVMWANEQFNPDRPDTYYEEV
ncbi:NAD-dependent epimerase/dehydratase family protein [Massilimicrobiota timonensis]|uniref:polysaccharide biosynthesis C-terminal domain-containing protein n=1 Tax=Massilimicrobiota timonensis TaxID=1776392 RepID=UPI00101CB168|nr:NAD-dependent epimerase/dehydratase family protein [Massilimicrobiota timonensis]